MVRPALLSLAAVVAAPVAAAALHGAPVASALTLPSAPLTTTATVTPPPPPGSQSVGYGYDPAHDFAAADPLITLPLGSLWSIKTKGDPVALIAADGVDLVLLDTPSATAPTGATIEGLDPNSGTLEWSSAAPVNAQIAYSSGIVAVAGGGHVQAYRYGIGTPAWNVQLAGVAAITPADGDFYADAAAGAGSAGTIDSINATTGAINWSTKPPTPGAAGPLAIAGNTVYRAESTQAQAFNRLTGKLLWHQGTPGSADTATLWQTKLFRAGFTAGPSVPGTTIDGGPLSAASGAPVAGAAAEIASGNVGLQTHGTGVVATDLSASNMLWSSFSQPLAILNGDALIATTKGGLELRNLTTGGLDWSATLPASATTFPTAVGNQELLVSTTGQLTALVPANYARMTTRVSVPTPYAVYGGAAAKGTAKISEPGIELAQALQIAAKPWPFKGYGAPRRVATDATGTLRFSEHPSLNTLYRISPAGSTTALGLFEIVSLPHVTYKFGKATATHGSVAVTVKVPSVVKLAHHRVSLYLGVVKRKRYVRLGGGTLSGRAGRFGASFKFTLQHHVAAKDFVTACFAGIYKQGMSFGDQFDRRCGAKRIGF